MAKIPLAHECAGTLKMFALYPELQDVLQNGGVFFVDELNARLHPLLVRNFILTFLNPVPWIVFDRMDRTMTNELMM